MDFPLDLKSRTLIKGRSEFRQDITLTFKNMIGSFYSSRNIGSQINIHGSADLVSVGVKNTLKQFPGTELTDLKITMDQAGRVDIVMDLKYRDYIEKFTFSI